MLHYHGLAPWKEREIETELSILRGACLPEGRAIERAFCSRERETVFFLVSIRIRIVFYLNCGCEENKSSDYLEMIEEEKPVSDRGGLET